MKTQQHLAVKDVWLALAIAKRWTIILAFFAIPLIGAMLLGAHSRPDLYQKVPREWWPLFDIATRDYMIEYALFVTIGIWIAISLRLLWAYGGGIDINLTRKMVSWPASDVENGIMDILMGKRIINHLHRETVSLADIRDLRNDNDLATDKRSRLNVSGTFGSRQLEFSSKQKRDECRSQMIEACRMVGVATTSDFNTDFT